MRKPSEEDGFEKFQDGDVTIHIGLEAIDGHVRAGVIVFYFGVFDHCRVRIDGD